MDRRSERFLKVYPWFYGFSGDLLFYIAIDTLFLTLVKGFSAAQIVSITSVSHLICLALQFPILLLVRRIGNTASVRLGAFLLLLASLAITFGEHYFVVLLGVLFRECALILESAAVVALENNLDLLDRRGEFVRIRARATMTYSVITLVISVIASPLFNWYRYLPMLCSIGTCTTGFTLSLFLKDVSDYDRVPRHKRAASGERLRFSRVIVLTVLVYSLFYLLVNNGQSEGKLFIQQEILLDFDEKKTAMIIGAFVFVSRLVRVLSNAIVRRVYEKLQAKMGVFLPLLMLSAVSAMLFGSFISVPPVKIAVMSLGYIIVLFSRDPFKLYMQDVILSSTPKTQHQTVITVLEFGVKLACAGVGLIYSAILVSHPMIVVISIMLALAAVEILLGLLLYRSVTAGKRVET